jgi:hypothetical protein
LAFAASANFITVDSNRDDTPPTEGLSASRTNRASPGVSASSSTRAGGRTSTVKYRVLSTGSGSAAASCTAP